MEKVRVFIEISKNSHIKYEFDKELKALVCDRILHTPFMYPFNYGFVPDTHCPDGDPLDAIVITDDELLPGSYIDCKILGCLETEDEEGVDPKMIMCPCLKVDPTYKNINNITDLPDLTLEKIKYFYSHYKDLENKFVKIGNFIDSSKALDIYKKSIIKS